MVSIVIAGSTTKLGCHLACLQTVELLGKTIDIHHNLLAQTGWRGWLTMSLGKHWYILPLIGIGLQLSYQLLYLWIENILKCFLHRKRHTGIVDVLRGQTEMDKLLVSIQSANLIKLFLDKILYSLDIVVGNLLDILDTLRIILIKVLIYLTQTSKQSRIERSKLRQRQLTQSDKILNLYTNTISYERILGKIVCEWLCLSPVTSIYRGNCCQ